ncbi:protein kinase family protein [Burkholderia sp. Ac-20365]|uniref:protein kinase family protein n=1 Tax=Burkholderia sp. Ac-20365 TaxID=2703897 RepID=UPI00197BE196|nr:protein kinase family protein [Burkholderia sp. Ac-20365]MBN3759295.1 protein kinase family protein [Burkholderia sp. Ac-20365]
MDNQVVKFVRQKDFVLEKRLGQGATGNTVLLHDPVINERFACKKYEPANPAHASQYFDAFVREIKLLHLINHPNIVRVFNYYLFPKQNTGYILMEYVSGMDIGTHTLISSDGINDIFTQTVDGFAYLEKNGILHRDIRESNILVTTDNVVKIIDFGFGKQTAPDSSYNKSISLNWWCDLPAEFKNSIYDFRTEVYFVGKLFEKVINELQVESFKHSDLLERMCRIEPDGRIGSFAEAKSAILDTDFGTDFTDDERRTYRQFADSLSNLLRSIENDAKYNSSASVISTKLEEIYRRVMLEDFIPDPTVVSSCFINGAYRYGTNAYFEVDVLKSFIALLRKTSREKQEIIIANLHSRLDAKPRHTVEAPEMDDDIPF